MAERIPQSTTIRVPFKALYPNGAPALVQSFNIKASKNGGLFANIATANSDATEIGNGWYYIPAGVAETSVQGPLIFLAHNPPSNVPDIEVLYDVVAADEFATLDQQANAVWSQVLTVDDEGLPQTSGELLVDMDSELDATFGAVLAIGSASATLTAVNVDGDNTLAPLKGVTFLGFQEGTYLNTFRHNDQFHKFTADNGGLDVVYRFKLPGGTTPINAFWHGYFTPLGASGQVTAYNFGTSQWDDIKNMTGSNRTDAVTINFPLFPEYVGVVDTPDFCYVYLRFTAIGQPGAVVATDQMYMTYADITPSVGYASGAVWVNTIEGHAGTELYYNGTADNPVDTLNDALTIAKELGVRAVHFNNGSEVILANNAANYSFSGTNWKIDLNTQNCDTIYIRGAIISGNVAGNSLPDITDTGRYQECFFGNVRIKNTIIQNCIFAGTLTIADDSLVTLDGGIDGAPGISVSAIIDFGTNVEAGLKNWHGGLTLKNLTPGCYVSLDGYGRVVLDASCTGGQVIIRGPFKLTDHVVGGFQGMITDTERLAEDQSVASVTGALGAPAVASIWAQVIEGSLTALQAMRGLIATAFGKVRGAPNGPIAIRDTLDTKDRITADVDNYGNRTSITKDLS